MNCYNCENEIRDKENQKICYDDCESYQKMTKRNKTIRENRRLENESKGAAIDSAVRATGRLPGRRAK